MLEYTQIAQDTLAKLERADGKTKSQLIDSLFRSVHLQTPKENRTRIGMDRSRRMMRELFTPEGDISLLDYKNFLMMRRAIVLILSCRQQGRELTESEASFLIGLITSDRQWQDFCEPTPKEYEKDAFQLERIRNLAEGIREHRSFLKKRRALWPKCSLMEAGLPDPHLRK